MTEVQSSRRIGRSVLAIAAGIVVIFITSMGTDAILHATEVFPKEWLTPMETHLWVLALAYRVPYGILSSYIAAMIAPNRPMWHAMLFGYIGLGMSILAVAANWNKGPEFGPMWFNLGLVAIAVPCAWIGGKLCEVQSRNIKQAMA